MIQNLVYANLEGYRISRQLSRNAIANEIGCAPKTLQNKLNGTSDFKWQEVYLIHEKFFKDVSYNELMKRTTQEAG